jgi:hypothetical protein
MTAAHMMADANVMAHGLFEKGKDETTRERGERWGGWVGR